MDDLKPCPFCGGEAHIVNVGRDWWRLSADHTDACILLDQEFDVPQTDSYRVGLIDDWNTRAQLSAQSVSAVQPVAWLYHDAPSLDALLADEASSFFLYSAMLSIKRQPSMRNETPLYTHPADADAVDAKRLDWLDQQGHSYGFEDMHEGNRWMIDGPFRTVREAIDAAIAAQSTEGAKG